MSQTAGTPPTPMPGLTEGRMVHYVLDQGPSSGEHRAAVITRIWDHGRGYCNLTVFVDGSNDGYDRWPAWITSVAYSEAPKPRTWHWIEKA
jgi:hypothetical protein